MSEQINDIVVVGAGLAGAKTVEALREHGFDGRLTLVGDETDLPYERPPLSKTYLAGATPFEQAVVFPADWYRDNAVELLLGTGVLDVDLRAGAATLASSAGVLRFDRLALATGAQPRRLSAPGAEAPGVRYLRTRADADAIRGTFGPDEHLLIIGGGWIGLEVAAAARQSGTAVTVLEAADLPLLAVLGPRLAQVFADLHRDHGVVLRTGAALTEICTDTSGAAAGARLSDGTVIDATSVVIGVGVQPRVDLARRAGLDVGNGVLVDAGMRTSDPRVVALGDIANHAHPVLRSRVRVEHWAAALNQPATAAANLLGGAAEYRALPYFYTDQYDLGMEYLGHAPPGSYERVVVRGDVAGREFVAFWLDGADRVKAAMNVNVWEVPDAVRPLIESGTPVDVNRLTDPAAPLADLA